MKNAQEKSAILKEREEQQRRLGKQIDHLILKADSEPPGCATCGLWRIFAGRSRTTPTRVAASEHASKVSMSATSTQERLFGRKKANPESKLAEAAASMEQRIEQLEEKARGERAEARRFMQNNMKPAAVRVLKRAKATEKAIAVTQSSLIAVEEQGAVLAEAAMQKQIATALASSSKGIKAQKHLLKSAESAVDDAADARDMALDLSTVMSEFSSSAAAHDEDELLAELEDLIKEAPSTDGVFVSDAACAEEDLAADSKAAEIYRLEARIARQESSAQTRAAVAAMPAAPSSIPATCKRPFEKQALLKAVV